MPNPLNNATCGDGYTDAATISDVWQSRGGWFSVASHSVYVQQQYGTLGTPTWTGEQLLGAGASGYMAPACRGIRFRNATAGSVATVAAAIAEGNEPPLSVLSLGTTVTLPSSLNFQHNDLQVATEPTVDFEDSATVTWAVVDDAANTRVKVTPTVISAPTPGYVPQQILTSTAVTPDLNAGGYFNYSYPVGPPLTLTFNAPANPPDSSHSTSMVIEVANNSANTITFSWNAAYGATVGASLPGNVLATKTVRLLFYWDSAKWRLFLQT